MSTTASFPHVVIRASAGTGKTYQLTNRFIGLLRSGVAPQQILATTFTRKAAGEIFDRVLLRLAQAATSDASLAELNRAIKPCPPLDLNECRQLLVRTVRGMDTLRIGTLDSFFARVATTFALEMGLPPGWNICDELTDAQLREEAIEAVLAREKVSDLLALMNLLTKGEAKRSIADIVSSTVNQLYSLYRETQPEAWQQLVRTKGLSHDELAKTLEALERAAVPGTACGKARDKECSAAMAGDWDDFVKGGLAAKVLSGENRYYRQELPDELVALYERLLKHAASHIIGQIALQTQGTFELLKKFSEEYDRLKHARRALRFDDVTHRLAQAMAKAADQIAYRLDSRISHVLLDEFQDTSLLQWRVLRPIAQRVTNAEGSFFCVGDTKQAIYGWRGGIAELFDALNDELQGLTPSQLSQSFRSSPPVIETVNLAFDRMIEHGSLERLEGAVLAWRKQFPVHTTARSHYPGYVCLRSAPAAGDDDDPKDILYEYTAQQVAESVKLCPGKSVGILVRTNDAVKRLIHYLRENGVAASEEGGNPLTDSAPVVLILSALRLADHPGDTVARFHVAHSALAERFGLADRWQRDETAAAASEAIRRKLLEEGYGPVVYDWACALAPLCSKRDLNRLQQLVELAFQFQPRSTLRTDDFIAFAEQQRVSDPTQDDVRVMTIHQSKGLQFDIVYLPELDARLSGQPDWFVAGRPRPTEPVDVVCRYVNQDARQLLPPRIQKLFDETTHQEMNEALCVLYVAMTRAVYALHMIVAPHEKTTLPKTFAGLLRAGLCKERALPPNTCGYECGDPRWYEKLDAVAERPDAEKEVVDVLPPKIRFVASDARRRGLERASPSQLEGGQRMPLVDIFRPQASEARRQGTLVHAWMQLVQWIDDGLPSTEALVEAAQHLTGEIGISHNIKGLAADWRKSLSQPAVQESLTKDYYRTADGFADKTVAKLLKQGAIDFDVHNERSFAVRDNGQMLVGTIDRLVLIRSGGKLIAADVIDFKTDQLSRDNPQMIQERVDFYRPQLAAYRRAVAQLYQLDLSAIAARLVLLGPGEVRAVG